jgi:hypothetical protein
MRMRINLLCLFIFTVSTVSTANLIRNPEVKTNSDGWILAGAKTGARVTNPDVPGKFCLMLKAQTKEDKIGYWTQLGLPIEAKKEYTLRYKVKGSKGGIYRVYVECSNPWAGFGTEWQTISNDGWVEKKMTFSFSTVRELPYLVLQIQPTGQVYFSDFSLIENPARPAESIYNGNFEQDLIGWESGDDVSISGGGYAGEKCLKLVSMKKNADSVVVQKHIPLKAGEKYRLTYWVKAGNSSTAGTGYQFFRVFASWDGFEQRYGLAWQDALQCWQRRTLEFNAPIKANSGVNITCQIQGPGTIFFDDLKLERIEPTEKNTSVTIILRRPSYRDVIFSSYPVDMIEGDVAIGSKDVRNVVVTFGRKNGTPVWSKEYEVSSSLISFLIPATDLSVAEYILTVEGMSEKGTVLGEDSRTIKKVASAANEVVIREDNVTMINGKPFFPIGLWDVAANERDLYEFSKAGFNLFRSPDLNQNILDMAQRQHMMVIGGIAEYLPENPADPQRKALEEASRNKINAFRYHPALLVYYLSDEPFWGGKPLEQLLASYHFHRELDPYHPIWINEAPRGEIAEVAAYGQACDIFGVDIYPIPEGCGHSGLKDQTMACIGKYTDRMRASVNDRKPIWMTLQGFAWGDHANLLNNGPKAPIYPTSEQSRFMAYDAIIHGATGIMYWGTDYIAEPAFWDVLFKTTSELRDMSRVFVSETVEPSNIKCDQLAVKILHKRCEGKDYLLAINDSSKPLSAKIITPFEESSFNVFFENREVKLQDSCISDWFKPYDVHVYSNSLTLPLPLVLPAQKMPEGKIHFLEAAQKRKQELDRKYNMPLYHGKANWIWYPGKYYQASQRTLFRKTFDLDTPVRKAVLLAAADGESDLYVNGQKIDRTFTWGVMKAVDVFPLVKQGKNVIAWNCFSGDSPPSGLFCELSIETADGEKIQIISDGTWKVSEEGKTEWQAIDFDDKNWIQAEVIGPTGTSPWGKIRVQNNLFESKN